MRPDETELADPAIASAAERPLVGLSSMATRTLLQELIDAWQRGGGAPVAMTSIGGVDAARRVASGEPCDCTVLASDAIDRLVADGHVSDRVDLARSGVAIAVRAGAARPGVCSEPALRDALRAARTIAYSTGPSGTALLALFDRWRLGDTLRDRLVQAKPGVPVGALVARGDAEIGFQQLSELMNLPGVDLLGPMPPGTEIVTTFSAAVCTTSRRAVEVRALLDFLAGPAAADAKRRHGMAPVSE